MFVLSNKDYYWPRVFGNNGSHRNVIGLSHGGRRYTLSETKQVETLEKW